MDDLQSPNLLERERRKTAPIRVGDLIIGGNNPVVVQEMTSTPTQDVASTIRQIQRIIEQGCRLVRVAVPNQAAVRGLKLLKQQVKIPIIADIHFDYRLALLAIEGGADKLRLNPGNIGGEEKVRAVVSAAKDRGIPIRVGVNSGSLQRDIIDRYGGVTAEGLVESALREVWLLEKLNFRNIIISIKSPDVNVTVKANKLLCSRVNYPIHIGITEAGLGKDGVLRSIVGLGILLLNGIGDTIRVSLTERDRTENIRVCHQILKNLHIPFL